MKARTFIAITIILTVVALTSYGLFLWILEIQKVM